MIGLLLLALSCAVLFLLPLAPAALEWLHPSDAAPLNVVREYGGHIGHFAAGFQRFVDAQLRPYLGRAGTDGTQVEAALSNGTQVIAVPADRAPRLQGREADARETTRLVLGAGDLMLPNDHIFSGEVYAEGSLRGGSGLVLRAVLAKGDIRLGAETYVLRWLHADGVAVAGEGSRLYGRASAGQRLLLGPGCRFGRMYAPRIEFTPLVRPAPASPRQRLRRREAMEAPPRLQAGDMGRWLVRGDLAVAGGTWHRGHLIASADLLVGAGAFVAGSIKGNRDVLLDSGSRVHGSVVAGARVVMERDSQAMGPIVAEDVVEIGPGCVVGAPGHPTTITAPRIRIAPGALVYGSIWAREEGEVLA
ncbi:hypothetical protein [Oryzomicrobium sp.]|uniref:hypothetical protein n=1 Tax=Oryzomicrobium sp. TaxID=1911578 RepID=UPI0025CD804C|nr:hypothetical protein [Oryzomicrobium sp.]MCE1242086.1 hypothetical protein [Oryzomicrobium sp.]